MVITQVKVGVCVFSFFDWLAVFTELYQKRGTTKKSKPASQAKAQPQKVDPPANQKMSEKKNFFFLVINPKTNN